MDTSLTPLFMRVYIVDILSQHIHIIPVSL